MGPKIYFFKTMFATVEKSVWLFLIQGSLMRGTIIKRQPTVREVGA